MPQGSHTARTNNSTVTYTIAPNKKFAGQHSSLKHLPVRSPGHSPLGVRSKLKNGSFKLLKAGSFDLHQAKYGGTRRNIVESNSQRSGDMVAKTTAPHMTTKKETEKISALQHNSEAKMVLKSSDYQKIASTNVKQSRNQEKVDDRRARELNRPNPALFIPKAKLQGATKFNNSNTNQTDYLSVPSPIIGQLDLATPTVRPGTTILRHHSLENLPECDPEWLQQCRGKIHRRIHHKPDDPVKYQDGNTPKSSPKDPKHQMLSPGKQKSSEEADLSVRSGTATVRNSRFQLKNLPCISPRDFAADSHQQSGLIDNMVGKSPQRSYYSQAEKRWKSDSKLRSLQKANQLMQAGANAQAANLKVVSSDYSSSDSITSNHSGHNNKSPLHKSHSDGQSKCRCTCECCIKGCWVGLK